jgi:cysteinyl-tRNA synthetase
MTLQIFDTLTGSRVPLNPITPGHVKIYVCGPTVYDDPHTGHGRNAVVYDVVARYLKARGYRVTLVRNLTDIDDKIVQKSRQLRLDHRILARRYIERYQKAMQRLNVAAPDAEPRATDYIPEMQDLIARLIRKGHAYRDGGDVYFAVDSFNRYGRLSGRTHRLRGAGEQAPTRPGKRHPADFALWKSADPQTPSWPSPWGPGRPGWHIECSAMSAALLGDVFDIHGGGVDLIFPHHENEIAQSESATGKTPANCWMHHGLLTADGRKISKSRANSMKLADLLDTCPPGAVRLFLLSRRYRHPLALSRRSLAAATRSFNRLQRFFARFCQSAEMPAQMGEHHSGFWCRFCDAMDDDFNFSRALSVIFEGVRHINRHLYNGASGPALNRAENLASLAGELWFMCQAILGLRFDPDWGKSI